MKKVDYDTAEVGDKVLFKAYNGEGLEGVVIFKKKLTMIVEYSDSIGAFHRNVCHSLFAVPAVIIEGKELYYGDKVYIDEEEYEIVRPTNNGLAKGDLMIKASDGWEGYTSIKSVTTKPATKRIDMKIGHVYECAGTPYILATVSAFTAAFISLYNGNRLFEPEDVEYSYVGEARCISNINKENEQFFKEMAETGISTTPLEKQGFSIA